MSAQCRLTRALDHHVVSAVQEFFKGVGPTLQKAGNSGVGSLRNDSLDGLTNRAVANNANGDCHVSPP